MGDLFSLTMQGTVNSSVAVSCSSVVSNRYVRGVTDYSLGREGAVEVRPFPAEKRPCVSEAQGLSGEAVKGNPMTTVIPGADESKPSLRTTEDLTEPEITISHRAPRDPERVPSWLLKRSATPGYTS